MKKTILIAFNMKRVQLCFISLLILSSSLLTAQTDSTHGRINGFRFSIGSGFADIPEQQLSVVNRHLQENDLSPISSRHVTWNIDLVHVIVRNTVFNLGMGGLINQNTVSDSSKTSMSGFIFSLGAGRVILKSRNILLYPMVGIDFGSSSIDAYYSGFTSAKDVSGSSNYHALNFSLTLDYMLSGIGQHNLDWNARDLKIPFSFVISFTVGFAYCPVDSYWNDNNFDLTNHYNNNVNYPVNVLGSVTSSNFSMFYANIKIGFGEHHVRTDYKNVNK